MPVLKACSQPHRLATSRILCNRETARLASGGNDFRRARARSAQSRPLIGANRRVQE
jgi:hypothetical protein